MEAGMKAKSQHTKEMQDGHVQKIYIHYVSRKCVTSIGIISVSINQPSIILCDESRWHIHTNIHSNFTVLKNICWIC